MRGQRAEQAAERAGEQQRARCPPAVPLPETSTSPSEDVLSACVRRGRFGRRRGSRRRRTGRRPTSAPCPGASPRAASAPGPGPGSRSRRSKSMDSPRVPRTPSRTRSRDMTSTISAVAPMSRIVPGEGRAGRVVIDSRMTTSAEVTSSTSCAVNRSRNPPSSSGRTTIDGVIHGERKCEATPMPIESAMSAGSRKPSDCAATCHIQKASLARRGRPRGWSSAARPTDAVATMLGRYRFLAYGVTSGRPIDGGPTTVSHSLE